MNQEAVLSAAPAPAAPPTTPLRGRELAYATLDHISTHPYEWHQGGWISRWDDTPFPLRACFGARACLLAGDVPGRDDGSTMYVRVSDATSAYASQDVLIEDRATELLGIPGAQVGYLLEYSNTLAALRELVRSLFGPRDSQ
jgi:hypothetical protein